MSYIAHQGADISISRVNQSGWHPKSVKQTGVGKVRQFQRATGCVLQWNAVQAIPAARHMLGVCNSEASQGNTRFG
eukprot:3284638-Amphidinium_carterae.1